MIKAFLLILFLLYFAQASSQTKLLYELSHLEKEKFNNISVIKTDTVEENNKYLFFTHFTCISGDDSSFYYTVVWKNDNRMFKLLWYGARSYGFEDYPHTFSYIDFNQDGKTDLLLLSGLETYFHTRAYLNCSADTFSENSFKLIFETYNNYSVLSDINDDGKPELINLSEKKFEETDPTTYQPVHYTDALKKRLCNKYDSITKNKKFCNFKYGYEKNPESYKEINSFVTDKITISEYNNGSIIDNTGKYEEYIKWRINFLIELKNDERNSKKMLDETIIYLKSKI